MAPTATASRPAKRSGSSASRRARWPRSASKPRNAANGASASTATATTAIARAPRAARADYVGRFAPSPTGSLHLGSLVAAVGSFADARSRGGRWLLRMEDLDAARVIPGCAERMLRMLEAFWLTWDGVVEYQSARTHHYGEALATLEALGLTFECSCTRAERNADGGYPGTCRNGPKSRGATATRFRVDDGTVCFEDRAQGECRFELRERGDVIIRCADLLDSTPWQIALQGALRLPTPHYLHLPLVTEPGGAKLAKARRSVALDPHASGRELHEALRLLNQDPPDTLKLESPGRVLEWACAHWELDRFHGVREVRAAAPGAD